MGGQDILLEIAAKTEVQHNLWRKEKAKLIWTSQEEEKQKAQTSKLEQRKPIRKEEEGQEETLKEDKEIQAQEAQKGQWLRVFALMIPH